MLDKKLFHVREEKLRAGSLILPGRWGQRILADGKAHPLFDREMFLERWRAANNGPVSRLNCAFAFDDEELAREYAGESEFIHSVAPTILTAPRVKVDMLWITWMSEQGATAPQILEWCNGYWSGRAAAELKPGAQTAWEVLISSPLVVV